MKPIAAFRNARSTSFSIASRTGLTFQPARRLPISSRTQSHLRTSNKSFSTTSAIRMSYSNADTGNKPADPYKAKNKDDATLKESVDDLVAFMDKCKFGMMTTRTDEGLLVSRCMALAAKVRTDTNIAQLSYIPQIRTTITDKPPMTNRKAEESTPSSTPTPNPAKPTT